MTDLNSTTKTNVVLINRNAGSVWVIGGSEEELFETASEIFGSDYIWERAVESEVTSADDFYDLVEVPADRDWNEASVDDVYEAAINKTVMKAVEREHAAFEAAEEALGQLYKDLQGLRGPDFMTVGQAAAVDPQEAETGSRRVKLHLRGEENGFIAKVMLTSLASNAVLDLPWGEVLLPLEWGTDLDEFLAYVTSDKAARELAKHYTRYLADEPDPDGAIFCEQVRFESFLSDLSKLQQWDEEDLAEMEEMETA